MTVLALTVVLLDRFGIAGAGLAFLIGQAAASVVVFPSVFRQYRRPGMDPHYAADAQLVAHFGTEHDGNPLAAATPPDGASRKDGARSTGGPGPPRLPWSHKTATP